MPYPSHSHRTIAKAWVFYSSSGKGTYDTILYDDGTLSCACPGWCKRVQGDGSRTCRHVRMVEMGIADSQAVNWHDYRNDYTAITKQQPTRKEQHAKSKGGNIPAVGQFGNRRIV